MIPFDNHKEAGSTFQKIAAKKFIKAIKNKLTNDLQQDFELITNNGEASLTREKLQLLTDSLKKIYKNPPTPESIIFKKNIDFVLVDDDDTTSFHFNIRPYIIGFQQKINIAIDQAIRKEYGNKIKYEVQNLNEGESKSKVLDSLKKLEDQDKDFAKAQFSFVEKRESASFEERKEWYKVRLEAAKHFTEKTSIAPVVGGIILFIYSMVILYAMFNDVVVTEIVQSAFLLILGYFFGQSTKKEKVE